MKKILHISKFYYPYYGGIEDVAHTIIKELEPYYKQKVICFNHEKGTIFNINGVDVLRVNAPFVLASQPISFTYRSKLHKIIKEFCPDYIHLHLPNPLIATYLLSLDIGNAKIISHWHSDVLGQKGIYPFYQKYEKKLLEKSHKIVGTSEMYVSASIPLKKFIDKIVVLPNTINETKFKLFDGESAEIDKIRKKYNNKKIVFFVGRHVGYKGIEYLIRAERFISQDCVIVIAGTGELNKKLRDLVGKNPRIRFVGRLSNAELKYYLYASTLFAFPSISRQEAFGVALAEALYCGLPAVSFHVEGSGALWVNKNGHTGLIVENKNVKEYAVAIDKILSSTELRNELSQNAIKWVESNFMKEQIVERMGEIYD